MGRAIGGLFALVSVGFITRSLGAEGFGSYATIVAYLSIFQILADFGLYNLLTREISQKPDKERYLVSQFLTLRLLIAFLLLSLATALVWVFPYSAQIKLGVVFAASAFLFMSLTQIFMSVFQRHLAVYKAAIAEVVGRGAQAGLVWYFFVTGGSLFKYLGALIAGSFIIFFLNLVFARRLVSFKLSKSFSGWKTILKTAYPIAISIVFTLLYFKSDTILLSVLKPQEDVGIYNAAYKVLETLIFLPAAFVGLVMPRISEYAKRFAENKNKEKLKKFLSSLTDIVWIAALPTLAGGILLSPSIVNFIGGAEFAASGEVLKILFIAIAIIFFGTLFGNTVIAMGMQKKAMWAYIVGFGFNLVLNLIFIPKFTYLAAAWTTVLTEFLVTMWLVWIIRKKVAFNLSLKVLLKSTLAVLAMSAAVFYVFTTSAALSPLSFIGAVLLGGFVYMAVAFVLKLNQYLKIAS